MSKPLQKTFRQRELVFTGPGHAEVRCSSAELGRSPYGVVIETKLSLISAGTEAALLRGDAQAMHGRRFPILPSATVTGQVIAVGAAVPAIRPDLRAGARVVAKAHHAAFVELNVLQDELCTLCDGPRDEIALLARLSRVASYSVRLIQSASAKSALVIGLGLVGQLVLRVARLAGCFPLVARDPHANRRASAARVDGVTVIAPEDKLPSAKAVFVACGDGNAIEMGLSAAADSGTVVLVGAGVGPVTIDIARHVFRRGVRMVGAHERFAHTGSQPADDGIASGLRILSDCRFRADGLITDLIEAADLGAAYEGLLLDKDRYVALAVNWLD